MKQDITYWNSKKSIHDYVDMKAHLFDSEKIFLQQATERLNKKITDIKILDLGCGGGRTTIVLNAMGYEVTGIDIAKNLIKKLNNNYPHIHASVGDAANLKFKSGTFDIVLFSHNSLDYPYPELERIKTLKEINRVLKPNGFFIFSSHNFRFLPYNYPVFKNIIMNIPRMWSLIKKGYYLEKMYTGQLVETYSITLEEMKKQLKKTGFTFLRSTAINEHEERLLMTFLKSWLSWERYYLAEKS